MTKSKHEREQDRLLYGDNFGREHLEFKGLQDSAPIPQSAIEKLMKTRDTEEQLMQPNYGKTAVIPKWKNSQPYLWIDEHGECKAIIERTARLEFTVRSMDGEVIGTLTAKDTISKLQNLIKGH